MKKLSALFLAIIMTISMVACGQNPNVNDSTSVQDPAPEITAQPQETTIPDESEELIETVKMATINLFENNLYESGILLAVFDYYSDGTYEIVTDNANDPDIMSFLAYDTDNKSFLITDHQNSDRELQILWFDNQQPLNVELIDENYFSYLVLGADEINLLGNGNVYLNEYGGGFNVTKTDYSKENGNGKAFPIVNISENISFISSEYYVGVRVPYGKFNELDNALIQNNILTLGGEENSDFNWLYVPTSDSKKAHKVMEIMSTIEK